MPRSSAARYRFTRPAIAALALSVLTAAHLSAGPITQSLAGQWRFALDRQDVGVGERWYGRDLGDRIELPGVLQARGYGDEISTATPWVLSLYDRHWYLRADHQAHTRPGHVKVPFVCQPPRHYLGVAWYQRDVEIPKAWAARRVQLFLERARWETTVWVDDRRIGSARSLVAPHAFELGRVAPGRHRLSVRVDNRMLLPYRPDAHAVSDSLNSTWNGIVGRIELRSTSPVWIADAQVHPELATRRARIRVRIGNLTGRSGHGVLAAGGVSTRARWTSEGGTAELDVPLGPGARPWDEFEPALQLLTLTLRGNPADDRRELRFGLREFRTEGRDFVINGRRTVLRGTHHGGDFPQTGHPPTDEQYWRKLFRTIREWGLNHVRFHSFCPPEAAFAAADEIGIYLQPEPGMWNRMDPGSPLVEMLYEESRLMLEAYGNHPSFALFSAGNEPGGRWKETLPAWVAWGRAQDPRRLYTTDTGWPLVAKPGPVGERVDYLAIHRFDPPYLMRGRSAWFGRDYAASTEGVDVPNVVHELGQWCAYPDFSVIDKFTGYMRPGNFEIFRDSAAAHGVLDRNRAFARASGRYQLACYKEEVEANLRTPGLGGFQLLDLHDYVGQGTALVGVLDPFWEGKGYVTAPEWRRFCNTTVPLARLTRRVLTTADVLEADVELAHYGPEPLGDATAYWRLVDSSGRSVRHGEWKIGTVEQGKGIRLGRVRERLADLPAPCSYTLVVGVAGTEFENDWRLWLYPAAPAPEARPGVLVTRSWTEAEARLAAGGRVLFLPPGSQLDWTSPPLDDVPVFWNRLMNPGWSRMLGLLVDAAHPALAAFPTEAHCDWQWTELTGGARALNLARLPGELAPIVQAIDDWNRNWKLGLVLEARVGPGRLLLSTFDLETKLDERPVARALRGSLLAYAASEAFAPATEVAPEQLRALWFDNRIMRRLGARASGPGVDAALAIDGDPNTSWVVGAPDSVPWPRRLTIELAGPVAMSGVVLMPRQNDRDHRGDVREYALEVSDDGQGWREVKRGALLSTYSPQTIRFDTPAEARWLRLSAQSGFADDPVTALAEVSVVPAGAPLPDEEQGPTAYERARSTSPDVEEGRPVRPRPR